MNKIYRLVWNASKNCWMAAAEIARSSGPRAATIKNGAALSFLGASLLAQAGTALPTATPTGSNTRSYVAANGTTVVDIATANSAGVSNNQYTQYNVNSQGLILNNGNTSQVTRQSQLAGQVYANVNLTNEASLILNQVVSTSRSTLAGFTEVLGSKADVVVANPNGITCSGCGFINTNRVTLSTGLPVLSGNGSLSGFNVSQGDILINGSGINASAQQILDLVSRSVSISGQVNAPDFGVYVGPNRWSYSTRSVTGSTTPTSTAPSYAIDTAVLGGMYANRIFLISTEAGVGVRMLGNAAANNGDFTLTAQGSIQLNNQLSATGNVAISANGNGSALQISDASISAGQNLALAAQDNVALTGSAIIAGQNLTLSGDTLTDAADSFSQSNNNTRYAGGSFSATFTDAATINGTDWGSAGPWQASFGSLSVGSLGSTLYSGQTLQLSSTSGDLSLGKSQLKSTGDMTLSASGAISTTADAAQGMESTAGNLSLTAGTGLNNAGSISADNGSATLRIGNSLVNSGELYAKSTLDIADGSGNSTENLTNTGTLEADNRLNLSALNISNNSVIQGGTAANNALTANGSLSNNAAGVINLATSTTGSGTVNANTVTNAGKLQSVGGLILNIGSGGLTNTNAVVAGGTLSMAAGNNDVTESGSGLIKGNVVNITANQLVLNNAATVQSDTDMSLGLTGLTFGSSSAHILASSASNTATGNITLASALVDNSGIYSGGNLNISAPGITVTTTGALAASNNLSINSTGDLSNSGSLYSGGNMAIDAGTHMVTNVGDPTAGAVGTMNSGGGITITAGTLSNNSNIQAAGDITVNAATINNEVPGGDQRVWTGKLNDATNQTHADTCSVDLSCTAYYYYSETWTANQYYNAAYPSINGTVTPPKPEIISGGTLTLSNFNTVYNLGGVISGHTVTLTGNTNSTVTNDDYHLDSVNYLRTYRDSVDFDAGGSETDTHDQQDSGAIPQTTVNINPSVATAGIYATTLNGSGFNLVNLGSPYSATSNNSGSQNLASNTSTATSSANTLSSSISFGGISITLPTNPNGYFVSNTQSNAHYLIETNPLLGNVNAGFDGSNYLLTQLGYNPDTTETRLGDANYEAYLIQQQIISKTGKNLINGYSDQTSEMNQMLQNGVSEAKSLGLTLGQTPTPEQLSKLTGDMVWMVTEVVDGQSVLVPEVFLAPATTDGIQHGGVISAQTANLNLASLTNTGGTISGSNALNISTTGDVTNTSGTITGGNVSVSAGGSITNKTLVTGAGNDQTYSTQVGKTGTISSTGDLNLNAGKDITNLGANVTAGGNATLSAGGSVNFDTLQDKTTSTTHSGSTSAFGSSRSSTTTTDVKQINSGLSTGGNLTVQSSHDITLAGTNTNVNGDANLNASGDVNIMARANSTTTHSESSGSGLGVGGGVYGKTSTVTDTNDSHNDASSLNVKGSSTVNAGGDLTLQGSTMSSGKDTTVNATNVNVLAGLDSHTSHSVTTTTTFLSTSSGGSSGASAGASSSAGGGQASADASAGAHASGNAGLVLASTSTTTTDTTQTHHVASSITSGGDLNVNAKKDVTLVGSTMTAGGNANVNASNVNVLAATDVSTTNVHNTTTSLGLMATSNNNANANASAGASDSGKVGAQANAQASASSNNTLNLMTTSTSNTNTLDITHQGSAITGGKDININASNQLTTQGSSLNSKNDINLNAKDMSFEAVTDVHQTTSNSSTTSLGLYANASAGASAGGGGSAGDVNGQVSGSASLPSAHASASVGAGVQESTTQTSSVDGSTTAVTSSLSAGGSINRNAKNSITDVGTNISAGGNLNQSATTISSQAAANTTYSSSNTSTNTTQFGAYAGATASTSAGSAGYGVEGQYHQSETSSSSNSSNAVVSNIHVGGTVNSKSSGTTTLDGTAINSGGDTNISGKAVTVNNAENTSSQSSSSKSVDIDAKVGEGNTSGLTNTKGGSQSSSSTSTAVAASINSGGKTNIQSTDESSSGSAASSQTPQGTTTSP